MKKLDNYDNLRALYKKSRHPFQLSIIIFAVIFVVAFISIFFDSDGSFLDLAMVMIVISVPILLILSLVALSFNLVTKRALKQFTDDELSRINEDIMNVPEFKGFYITRDALIYGKAQFNIIPLKDIIWIYKQVTTHRTNGIPTGKSYSAIIALKNKKSKTFATNKKDDLMDFLHQEISKYRKGVFYGYSDETHALYNMYIDRMIQMSEEAERQ